MEDTTNNSPKFQLGLVVMTSGIRAGLLDRFHLPFDDGLPPTDAGRAWLVAGCLYRHQRGDWGDVDEHDGALNDASASDAAIRQGDRVMSAYAVP